MMIFELIQVALGQRERLSHSLSVEEWGDLYETAIKQSVVGIAFEGVRRLPKEQCPPQSVLFQWIGHSEQIKAKNQLLNERSVEVTKLFSEAGFSSCILKGQGNAQMYHNPFSRMPGDIDIWILGHLDGENPTDKELRTEINQFVKGRCPEAFEQSHHIEFPIFRDVSVEVHYKPGTLVNPIADRRFLRWCNDMKDDIVNCPLGFYVPSVKFNAVFQMAHIMVHFFIEGIGLRQFIDYYYVLKSLSIHENVLEIRSLFNQFGLLQFAKGVMWIQKECLGLEDQYLIVEPDKRIGKVILKEMIEGGNFGHYDERYKSRKKGYISRGLTDVYRLMTLASVFPSESMWKIYRKVENQKWKIKRN